MTRVVRFVFVYTPRKRPDQDVSVLAPLAVVTRPRLASYCDLDLLLTPDYYYYYYYYYYYTFEVYTHRTSNQYIWTFTTVSTWKI